MIIPQAERLSTVHEYYFSRKLEQIRQLNELGRDIINLGIGSPDLYPRDQVIEAAIESLREPQSHGYSSYRSSPALRLAIANWYQNVYQVKASQDREILPLLGSKEGLFYIAMAFLNSGDQALVPNPGYPTYSSVTTLAGATALSYDLCETNSWWPDFDKLEKENLDRVKLMWVNYPNMPTGAVGSAALFQKLIDFGRKHNILICHDNPYSLVLNQEPPLSILKFDPHFEVALELNSLSKSFHMAGWRIGMLLGHREVIDTVIKVKSNVDSGMFQPIQSGAIEALATTDEWHNERNEVYRQRREWAYKIFDKLKFSYPSDPAKQVGLFLWGKAPVEVDEVEHRLDEVLDRAGVFLTPGFIFGSQGNRYARCSLCAPVDRLKEAYSRMEKFL